MNNSMVRFAGHYDAILMDVQMPVMMGYQATREIKGGRVARRGGNSTIAMTANAFPEDVAGVACHGHERPALQSRSILWQ